MIPMSDVIWLCFVVRYICKHYHRCILDVGSWIPFEVSCESFYSLLVVSIS